MIVRLVLIFMFEVVAAFSARAESNASDQPGILELCQADTLAFQLFAAMRHLDQSHDAELNSVLARAADDIAKIDANTPAGQKQLQRIRDQFADLSNRVGSTGLLRWQGEYIERCDFEAE